MTFWNNPINFIAAWLTGVLTGWHLPAALATILLYVVGITVLIIFAMTLDIGLVWIERKVVARFQDRLGPNRIGPFGLIQPVADIIKMVIKEDITPDGADKIIYNIAPVLAATSVILLWAILPLASTIYGVDLNVGLLYIVAAGALGTLAIIMAGWSSNNKYALLGAFRMVSNMISYEIPMVIILLIPTILANTMSVRGITQAQSGMWFAILSPLALLIFLISAIAELGRSPFDLNEAESEIVAGFHIEYTGMKFGWFYAGELLHAFTFGGFMAILFFGGYGGFFGLEKLACLHLAEYPIRAGAGLHRQGHVWLLGDHVDQVLGAAYPHRPYAGLQLEIPCAAFAGGAGEYGCPEQGPDWPAELALRAGDVRLEHRDWFRDD